MSPRPAAPVGKVALLIDAENISATLAPTILSQAALLGEITVRRAYGKLPHVAEWENHGFRLIPASTAKNSADLSLCVDAMTLALREEFPTLVIASSDRDFSPLALQLREMGFLVVGMGGEKAPLALRRACSEFFQIDVPRAAPEPAKTPAPRPAPSPQAAKAVEVVKRVPAVDEAALHFCRALAGADAPARLADVCNHLRTQGFTLATVEQPKWSDYFAAHPAFTLTGDGKAWFLRPL